MRELPAQQRSRRLPANEADVLEAVKAVVGGRPTYGYRRTTALLNRARRGEGKATVNHKRVYRLMATNQLLLQRCTGRPERLHEGRVVTLKSDLRYCSDALEIRCWNGEKVQLLFSLDCCDREVMAFSASAEYPTGETVRDVMANTVEHRFGVGAKRTPHPITRGAS